MEYTYIEILTADESGKILVDEIMKKYMDSHGELTHRIHGFKGIGHLPSDINKLSDIKTGKLLKDLPKYLKGMDASLKNMAGKNAIFVILDSDDNDCAELKKRLLAIYRTLGITVRVYFCIAIEEMEAWLLGDGEAVAKAYPNAKTNLLQKYPQDGIVGTWEYLADVVYPGGVKRLKKEAGSYYEVGKFKCECAKNIGQHINIENNKSPSFHYFINKLDDCCERKF